MFKALKANQENQENVGVATTSKKTKTRYGKRSISEISPGKAPVTRKRTAFGDITNVRIKTFFLRNKVLPTFFDLKNLDIFSKWLS